jgi:uncharacterized membrane protein
MSSTPSIPFSRARVKRSLSALLSLAYPVLVLVLLRRFAASIPAYASLGLKLYPVAVSAVLFAYFFRSLFAPQTVVERMARLRNPELGPEGVSYTRKVTKIWCVFFVLNGALALGLALWGSDRAWALYTGLIAYILMGMLFAGEWLVRRRVMHAQS